MHVPPSEKALERRLKKRFRHEALKLYALCQPGFEKNCLKEIEELITDCGAPHITQGGIEFHASLESLYLLNNFCRTAERLYLRIGRFFADSYSLLEHECKDVPWELYLTEKRELDFTFSIAKSKLHHTDGAKETIKKAIAQRMQLSPVIKNENAGTQLIHVRVIKDIWYLSLDSSGAPLYKRGLKKNVQHAPLRETLASLLLQTAGLSNYDILIDPMAGSGTFSAEALMASLGRAMGNYRDFAFYLWPSFNRGHCNYTIKAFEAPTCKIKVFTSDKESSAASAIRENLAPFEVRDNIRETDFFTLSESDYPQGKKLLLLNPPYGKRIVVKELEEFYRKILAHLSESFPGTDYMIIIPKQVFPALGLDTAGAIRLVHGGIETVVYSHFNDENT